MKERFKIDLNLPKVTISHTRIPKAHLDEKEYKRELENMETTIRSRKASFNFKAVDSSFLDAARTTHENDSWVQVLY